VDYRAGNKMLTVSYFSSGVSSAVATKLVIKDIDRIVYTHIDDQHPDTMRFVKDCEKWFGKPVEIMQSKFKSVDEVCRYASFIKSRNSGGVCTDRLKRNVRKQFEYENEGNLRVMWGLDFNEQDRADRLKEYMPDHEHLFPLVERRITKAMAHEMLSASGIKRPAMYEMGYHNNNCVGCVKGGMGYWNKIRVDFPEVFASRSKLERDLNFSIIKGVYLSELDPERGRHEGPICNDCGIMCEIMNLT
jgi:hypothetical protein